VIAGKRGEVSSHSHGRYSGGKIAPVAVGVREVLAYAETASSLR